jgi:tubulin polyglutamylase TTLL6/13
MKMRRYFPSEYDFFPQTFLLPIEYNELRRQMMQNCRRDFYIMKPEALCQGRGIFLCRDLNDVNNDEHLVTQRYLNDPFLLDGLKFDLRIYVLLSGVNPLRIHIFEDGLMRMATEEYCPANDINQRNLFMHLTNYAINKTSTKFVENNDETSD